MNQITAATITDLHSSKLIARVELNGYKSPIWAPAIGGSRQRVLWSFAIADGGRDAVERLWSRQRQARLTTVNGQDLLVRVIAFPVDRGSYGLLELL